MFVNTENKLIWKNGSFQSWDDSNVHILSHTLHYGTGVFEGVRAYKTTNGAAVFRLLEHTERLFSAAEKLNINIPYSIDEVMNAQCEILNENNLDEKNSYLLNKTSYKFDNSNSLSFSTRQNKKTNLTEYYNLIYQYRNDCLTASIEYNKNYYEDRDIKPEESIFLKLSIIPFGETGTPNLKK